MTRFLAIVLALWLGGVQAAQAQRSSLSLIRDAEIEHIIRAFSTPIFRAAALNPDSVKVHIVNDSRINAFVAGGDHMFVNTGLLMRADDPSVVIGVIAHETGHIVGNHIIRLRAAIEEAQVKQIIAFILAGAAAAAARDGRAAAAAISLGQRITAGTLFQYTQGMETEADRFAFRVLDQAGVSAAGLEALLETLSQQEALLTSMQDPYLRSHPLTTERVRAVREHIRTSPVGRQASPARLRALHARMRAKLRGFLLPPERVHDLYSKAPNSVPARYARAVAYHQDAQTEKAVELIDSLIREDPKDAFFHELKGQILLESARPRDAIAAYRTAVRLAPREPLIRSALGHAMLQANETALTREALQHLVYATRRDETFSTAWRLLGVAYGRLGDIGQASVALAEYYLLTGNKSEVRRNIARAEHHLRRGSPAWRRIQDIKVAADYQDRRRRPANRRNDPNNRERKTR